MSTLRHSLDAAAPAACRAGVLTLGNFDGVHRGHQALITESVRQARAVGSPAVAVTFDPHPLQLLRPAAFQPVLTTIEHRAELLHAAGADHVLILQTTPAMLQLSAHAFFAQVVQRGMQARALVEGYNFAFGKGREGTPDVLRHLCTTAGIPLTLVPPQEALGKPASSSRVRDELLAGRLDIVQALLGRPYRIAGTVVVGQRRGQRLGFPTANLDHVQTLIPGNGVYAVRVMRDGSTWPAAANVGPNPTFGEDARKIEVHLIGFAGDLYGQPMTIDFLAKIRDVRSFANVEELVAQVRTDVERAKMIVAV
jgi:riboflavin kinase / FMN adenylyltransferase